MPVESPKPSIALAGFVESLIDGKRVVAVGDANGGLGEQLLERGARLVHFADSDPGRAGEAAARNTSRNVTYAPLAEGGLGVRDGAFDVAVVENLAASTDPAALLRQLRRVLAPQGALVVASPNAESKVRMIPDGGDALPSQAIDYYELYDAIAAHFDHVTMLGQTPFVGYAIANFAPAGDPDPMLDTGFVPGGAEEPEWFVAVASQHPVRIEDFAVVQLPFRNVLGPSQEAKLDDQLRAARGAEKSARERMAQLEAELERTRERLSAAEASGPDESELLALREALESRTNEIAQLEARAASADARAETASVQLGELQTAHAETADSSRDREAKARADLDEARRKITELEAHVAEGERAGVEAALDKANARITELESAMTATADEEPSDVAGLEQALAERGRQVRRLEADLREAERIGHELVGRLAAAAPVPAARAPEGDRAEAPADDLRGKLDALAALNAQREADLEAARWTIQELEDRLASAPGTEGETLARELERARAEVQKQSALIHQLRAGGGAGGRSLTGA